MENSQNRENEREYFWQYDVDGQPHRVNGLMAQLQCLYLRMMIDWFRPLEVREKEVRT